MWSQTFLEVRHAFLPHVGLERVTWNLICKIIEYSFQYILGHYKKKGRGRGRKGKVSPQRPFSLPPCPLPLMISIWTIKEGNVVEIWEKNC